MKKNNNGFMFVNSNGLNLKNISRGPKKQMSLAQIYENEMHVAECQEIENMVASLGFTSLYGMSRKGHDVYHKFNKIRNELIEIVENRKQLKYICTNKDGIFEFDEFCKAQGI